MEKIIIKTLEKLQIADYRIRREENTSMQLYFIKKKLDMRRLSDTTLYTVTVFRDITEDGDKLRGSSDAFLFPDMDPDEMEKALADAYQAAAHAGNPYYPLYAGQKETEIPCPVDLPLEEAVRRMTEALFAADCREDAFLNSSELYVETGRVHIISSAGCDVTYTQFDCNGEIVTQCLTPRNVEQFTHFRYRTPDAGALKQKVADALETVCDRAKAENCPKTGTYDIVLYGQHLRTLLDLYLRRAAAGMVYPGYSDYAPGMELQGEEVSGERLNLVLLPDAPYSPEGIPMKERQLIREGRLECLYGDSRFCSYLGVEPTGNYHRVRLDNGSLPFDELARGCLYPVSFSDFQMDAMTGYFGGEIRLAYLFHEDGSFELLTGGSINGSLLEKQQDLTFSTEHYHDASYEGPYAVRIRGVAVAGI